MTALRIFGSMSANARSNSPYRLCFVLLFALCTVSWLSGCAMSESRQPVIVMPKPVDQPQPVYPTVSRRLGEQGKVTLRVKVDESGYCTAIAVSQSSGHQRLDQAALDAVQRWIFQPGTRNGVPVSLSVNIPVLFRLE